MRQMQGIADPGVNVRAVPNLPTRRHSQVKSIAFAWLLGCVSAAMAAGAQPGTTGGSPGSGAGAKALQPFIDAHTLAGAVAVTANQEGILDTTLVGWADIAAKKPMQADDLFWIASESKPITATAFMMLVDEGRVSLDDPVSKYIPEFGNLWVGEPAEGGKVLLSRPAHAVTVREILSHTAGMAFSSPMEAPTLDGLSLKTAVASYALTPLQHEPGTKYQYSNAGINTAGRIIEVISGMPYETFLQKRLFDPLGMKETSFWPTKRQLERLAKAYMPGAGGAGLEETNIGQLHYPLDDRTARFPMPAGGLFSTAGDLVHFAQMILNGGVYKGHRLLSENAIKLMTMKQTPAGVPDSYGIGWAVGPTWVGHGGALATNLEIDHSRNLITIWMVQAGGFPGNGGDAQGQYRNAILGHLGLGK